jgi:glycosyltransferase involved in cell wall biosynthesis
MLNNKRIAIVLPAYNASKTLSATYGDLPHEIIDEIILVDDSSKDETVKVAAEIGIIHIVKHEENKGYGANQKTCYNKALDLNCDIIIMVHPDYQYTPKLVMAMASIIAYGVYPVVFGSRILGNGALKGGMPYYKYVANRMLTLFQNLVLGQKLSEYHTGFRAFDATVLSGLPLQENSDDFIFDNEMAAQIFMAGYEIGEITCPTRYFEEASSINFRRSVIYGFGVVAVCFKYRLQKWKLGNFRIFSGLS